MWAHQWTHLQRARKAKTWGNRTGPASAGLTAVVRGSRHPHEGKRVLQEGNLSESESV